MSLVAYAQSRERDRYVVTAEPALTGVRVPAALDDASSSRERFRSASRFRLRMRWRVG
jgi:hypothetical protein